MFKTFYAGAPAGVQLSQDRTLRRMRWGWRGMRGQQECSSEMMNESTLAGTRHGPNKNRTNLVTVRLFYGALFFCCEIFTIYSVHVSYRKIERWGEVSLSTGSLSL